MATIYQGVEQITCANGSRTSNVYWWTTTNHDISLVSTVHRHFPKQLVQLQIGLLLLQLTVHFSL